MNWERTLSLAVGVGLFVLGATAVVTVVTGVVPASLTEGDDTLAIGARVLAVLVAIVVFLFGVVALRQSTDSGLPAGGEPLFERDLERVPRSITVTGVDVAEVVATAGQQARQADTVADGLVAVRPTLQATLRAVLTAGGDTQATAKRRIDSGTWTDDPVAAAVCSGACEPPVYPLRERLRAWLFPERVARERVRTAVTEIAATGERSLPHVPGQNAPRNIPVTRRDPGAVTDEEAMAVATDIVQPRAIGAGLFDDATAAHGATAGEGPAGQRDEAAERPEEGSADG
jgi:hypothetical protein